MIGVQDETVASPGAACLPLALVALARRHPDGIALREKHLGIWQQYSYQGYLDNVLALARGLASVGVAVGDRVGIVSGNRAAWFFADLAIQGLGAQTVGIDPGASAEAVVQRLCSTTASVVLLEDEEQYDKLLAARAALPALRTIVVIDDRGIRPTGDPSVLTVEQLRELGENLPLEWRRRGADHANAVATLLEVGSGPGSSVRTMHHHELSALTEGAQWALGALGPNDNVLTHLPLSHVTERTVSIVGALRWGYTANIATDPDLLVSELREVQPSVIVSTGEVWQHLAMIFQARLANASRFKRWLGQRCVTRGHLLGPLGTMLWYRPARRQMGMTRVRHAVSTGPAPDSEVLSLFASLGVPIVTTDFTPGAQL